MELEEHIQGLQENLEDIDRDIKRSRSHASRRKKQAQKRYITTMLAYLNELKIYREKDESN